MLVGRIRGRVRLLTLHVKLYAVLTGDLYYLWNVYWSWRDLAIERYERLY
jgi:hypothetical protein